MDLPKSNDLVLEGIKKDTLRVCGFCGVVYSINVPEHSGRCPNCKSRIQKIILDS
ncbi:MAG TPA: hypothetical protein VEU72_01430 [Nitrosopumilaceae archaeon]|nr:hypothetical protein [Nitrosopumilaceae archaeon]